VSYPTGMSDNEKKMWHEHAVIDFEIDDIEKHGFKSSIQLDADNAVIKALGGKRLATAKDHQVQVAYYISMLTARALIEGKR